MIVTMSILSYLHLFVNKAISNEKSSNHTEQRPSITKTLNRKQPHLHQLKKICQTVSSFVATKILPRVVICSKSGLRQNLPKDREVAAQPTTSGLSQEALQRRHLQQPI